MPAKLAALLMRAWKHSVCTPGTNSGTYHFRLGIEIRKNISCYTIPHNIHSRSAADLQNGVCMKQKRVKWMGGREGLKMDSLAHSVDKYDIFQLHVDEFTNERKVEYSLFEFRRQGEFEYRDVGHTFWPTSSPNEKQT